MRKTSFWRGPIFWAKSVQIALLCAVTLIMLGAGSSRYERLGHELMCTCTCGQVLLECNHVGCQLSNREIDELKAQMATGASDKAILDWFANKYGATVLAAPIRGGFDLVAWIMPLAVFALATAGTFVVVWLWKRRALSLAPPIPASASTAPPSPEEVALRARIRRETEY